MDLGLVLTVVATAAAVSTAVATGTTLYLQQRSRPEPDWALGGHWDWPGEYASDEEYAKAPPNLLGTINNAGDGPAFRLAATGVGCEPHLGRSLPRASGSGSSNVHVAFHAVLHPGDESTVVVTIAESQVSEARVFVEWTRSPTRLGKRRSQSFKLEDFAPLPPRPTRDR